MTPSFQRIVQPELIFGFVAPIGAEVAPVVSAFRTFFEQHDYDVVELKVTDVFAIFEKYVKPDIDLVRSGDEQKRYSSFIAFGNQLRTRFGDDILAATAIQRIMKERLRYQKRRGPEQRFSRTVYLLHQFKRKEEIELLRSVYGRLFFQVSVYSRRGTRVDYLSRKFASSDHSAGATKYRDAAEALVQRDENEVEQDHGQRVASIFHDADFIVSLGSLKATGEQVHRFCELLFGSNSHSPTRAEYGLFLAKAAALRSVDLSRQVGAALFSEAGEVISLGSNEVPKAGGGTYWCEDEPNDDRDFRRQKDSNVIRKREILDDFTTLTRSISGSPIALMMSG